MKYPDVYPSQECTRRAAMFWNQAKTDRPAFGFQIGIPNPALRFAAGRRLAAQSGPITPEMVEIEDFLDEYRLAFDYIKRLHHDAIWSAEPFSALPWVEAMLGYRITPGDTGFIASSGVLDPTAPGCTWSEVYDRFLSRLEEEGRDSFPVGQPVLHGPALVLTSILGTRYAVRAVNEEPVLFAETTERAVCAVESLIQRTLEEPSRFADGHVMGVFHLWALGTCLWLQDNRIELFSQMEYEALFLFHIDSLAWLAGHSIFRLRLSSLYLLESILSLNSILAIAAQMETQDLPIVGLISILKHIQERGRCLVIHGSLNKANDL